jgi:hypothetical protein
VPPQDGAEGDQPVHLQPCRQGPDRRGEDRAVGLVEPGAADWSAVERFLNDRCFLAQSRWPGLAHDHEVLISLRR